MMPINPYKSQWQITIKLMPCAHCFWINRFVFCRWQSKFSSNITKLCSWDLSIRIASSMIAFMRRKRYERFSTQKLQKKHKHSSQTQEHLNIFQFWIAHEIGDIELQYPLSFQVIWTIQKHLLFLAQLCTCFFCVLARSCSH